MNVPDHPLNVEVNSLEAQQTSVDDSTALHREIHKLIGNYPNLSVYTILGALRVVESDMIDMLSQLGRPA